MRLKEILLSMRNQREQDLFKILPRDFYSYQFNSELGSIQSIKYILLTKSIYKVHLMG
jgi:hypothetical protein